VAATCHGGTSVWTKVMDAVAMNILRRYGRPTASSSTGTPGYAQVVGNRVVLSPIPWLTPFIRLARQSSFRVNGPARFPRLLQTKKLP